MIGTKPYVCRCSYCQRRAKFVASLVTMGAVCLGMVAFVMVAGCNLRASVVATDTADDPRARQVEYARESCAIGADRVCIAPKMYGDGCLGWVRCSRLMAVQP